MSAPITGWVSSETKQKLEEKLDIRTNYSDVRLRVVNVLFKNLYFNSVKITNEH